MRWFEDFSPGQVIPLGSRRLEREEIVEFARRYDPQPFHLDEQAAAASALGGLAASGWQTAAVWMRLYVDAVLRDAAGMGSPGVEELRWWLPVRPADILHGTARIDATVPSSRRPDRGTVHLTGELRNGHGALVMSLRARTYFGRRPAGGASGSMTP